MIPVNATLKASKKCVETIKRFEGVSLKAYVCPAGVWTIGYGSTGPHVKQGMVITPAQADALLAADLRRFEDGVIKLVKVPLEQGQFDALVSFAFNVGLTALAGSTLLRKLNSGDYVGAQMQFGRWNKAGGKVLDGLSKRRAAEVELWVGL
jgi:lysozyme